MKIPTSKVVILSMALVVLSLSVSVLAAPSKQSSKAELVEIVVGTEKEVKPVRHHSRHLGRMRQVPIVEPNKDTYVLLRSLRKIQGHDGRSPVCKICTERYVDATTYDYFCLPDSEGMDGEICDRLTVLGTTTTHRINVGCKMLLSRHTTMCK